MDRRLTRQITHLVTNSQHMAGRIKEIYGREAEVVYPPVATSEYPFSRERQDFYLVAGRLLSYKKVDVAIQACQKLGRRLRVVGSGPEEARLRAMAQDGVEFLGRVPESQLKQLYSQARALLYPGYEDLGLIPLEAQATGCPVIAFGAGGVLETVLPDQTGIFFQEQNSAALEDAIVRFEKTRFEHALIRQHAQRFDIAVFKEKIVSIVNRYLPENKQLE
jgi:glycosyltransferase involved in cell wall biosynthesis